MGLLTEEVEVHVEATIYKNSPAEAVMAMAADCEVFTEGKQVTTDGSNLTLLRQHTLPWISAPHPG